jgi:hypothetical protein
MYPEATAEIVVTSSLEVGAERFSKKVGIQPQDYIVSQPRSPNPNILLMIKL